jgi:nitric oxide dioxygenase
MVQSAVATTPQRDIAFIHGSLNEAVQAFKPTLDALASEHPNLKLHYRYSEPANAFVSDRSDVSVGFIDEALFDSVIKTRDAQYYFCGPVPFLARIYRLLGKWEVPTEQIHFEFFGPFDELNRA